MDIESEMIINRYLCSFSFDCVASIAFPLRSSRSSECSLLISIRSIFPFDKSQIEIAVRFFQ